MRVKRPLGEERPGESRVASKLRRSGLLAGSPTATRCTRVPGRPLTGDSVRMPPVEAVVETTGLARRLRIRRLALTWRFATCETTRTVPRGQPDCTTKPATNFL